MPKPATPGLDITATTTHLTVRRPLPDLPELVAEEIREWLTAHGLDEKRIRLGSTIVRDGRALIWEENVWAPAIAEFMSATCRIRGPEGWPLPFPPLVLEYAADLEANIP